MPERVYQRPDRTVRYSRTPPPGLEQLEYRAVLVDERDFTARVYGGVVTAETLDEFMASHGWTRIEAES